MSLKSAFCTFALLLALSAPCLAQQEPELPLTWAGKGVSWFMTQYEGVDSIDYQLEINIDTDGWVTGKASVDDGEAKLEKFYYTPMVDGVRSLVVVLKSDGDEPKLFILKLKSVGKNLMGGDVYVKNFEQDGKAETGLSLSDHTAVEFSEDYLPSSLKTVIWNSKLIGFSKIEGDFTK
ncbi:MAG: hypothetical protein GC154_04920 [bacterium]|nr:hypothetical protein [bacterium]